MSDLTTNDYIKILEFYQAPIPSSPRLIQRHAERLLAGKLCRCIKRVDKDSRREGKAIRICTRSVIQAKGLTRGAFSCKGRTTIRLKKRGSKRTRKQKLK